jgi:hypothetical protein
MPVKHLQAVPDDVATGRVALVDITVGLIPPPDLVDVVRTVFG